MAYTAITRVETGFLGVGQRVQRSIAEFVEGHEVDVSWNFASGRRPRVATASLAAAVLHRALHIRWVWVAGGVRRLFCGLIDSADIVADGRGLLVRWETEHLMRGWRATGGLRVDAHTE